MKKIRIIRGGLFNSQGQQVPVGTVMEVSDTFNGWQGKWELVAETKGKTLEPATQPEANDGLDALRDEYERVIGEKPHGRMKEETLKARIDEAKGEE